MAKKKLNLAELTTEEVKDKLKEDTAHYAKSKFNHVVSSLENPSALKAMRRDIARMKTELHNRATSIQPATK